MLDKNEWAIKNEQSRETGNIGYTKDTRRRQTKQSRSTETSIVNALQQSFCDLYRIYKVYNDHDRIK
jgi:hypothetical protein